MKISIFTTFRDADPAYSLNRVVQTQIKMLTDNGYQPTVIVAEGFEPIEEYLKAKVVSIPNVPVSNSVEVDKTFDQDVEALKTALRPILLESDVVLTHDLVYQPAALKHNVAIRDLMKEKELKDKVAFIHWIHSAGAPAALQRFKGGTGGSKYLETVGQPFPNSFYIAFNRFSVPRIASWFGVEESLVKYVPHPHDFYEFWHPDAIKIAEKGNLLNKDVIILYPVRLDRGKQPEYIIKIANAVKQSGRSVSAVFVDFHSTGGDKLTYREELKSLALNLGMSENEVIFASEIDGPDKPLRASFPHQVVSNLFEIANTFILPSKSETYSLIAQEAAVRRNFLILNFDFPPFRSIYGDAPAYRKFSSEIDAMSGMDGQTNTQYSNEDAYWLETAGYINYVQEHTRVLELSNQIRKTRNLNYVFKKNIEPLFFAEDKFNY